MKKKLATLMIVACVLASGCGNGVSQDEYNAVVEERDKLKIDIEKSEKVAELRAKIAEYQARIDAEYEHAKFVIYVAGNVSGNDIKESTNDAEELRDKAMDSMSSAKSMLESLNSKIDVDEDMIETTQESIDGMFKAWEDYYTGIVKMEKYIMGE